MQTELADSSTAWAEILGRAASRMDVSRISRAAGRCVLVTGAGGFIGAEMVRLLAGSGAGPIILLDIAEQSLFRIHAEMAAAGHGERCVPVLGSVCDAGLLRAVFEAHLPELVLHAAALKHVPLMERNPVAAIETNALGTARLAQAAQIHGTRATVLVSTDKAVAPHSIMGAAKRIAEMVVLAEGQKGMMRCVAVRLANVIGSPGSVGPVFQDQIARGGPVTVTHAEARRYFLTLEEVTALLAESIESDTANGVLVPDPGEAVSIAELARRMMRSARREVPISFVGLRPGDKLDEALAGANERAEGRATPGLRRVQSCIAPDFADRLGELEKAVVARDVPVLLRMTRKLVPEYQPSAFLCESIAEAAQR